MTKQHRLIILGSGPAGYAAAIYAARADLRPAMIAGREPGGQLMLTSEVENWPGEPSGVMGPELMEKLKTQALKFGTDFIQDMVTAVDFSVRPFKISTHESGEFLAETVIISTGATAMWLNIPGEKEFKNRGNTNSRPLKEGKISPPAGGKS